MKARSLTGTLSQATSRPAVTTVGAICWLRRDLRLHDNAALLEACSSAAYLLPCYVLDPRELQPRRSLEQGGLGVPKLGPHRCRFILESLRCLKQQLQQRGSDLSFHMGRPEQVIPQLALRMASDQAVQHIALHYHAALAPEEEQQEHDMTGALQTALLSAGVTSSMHCHWGMTLYHPEDLPSVGSQAERPPEAAHCSTFRTAGIAGMADIMSDFRKAVVNTPVRPVLPVPTAIPQLPTDYQCSEGHMSQGQQQAVQHQAESRFQWSDSLPSTPSELYERAGPSAIQALSSLCKLTGLDIRAVQPGHVDARSAFALQGGVVSGEERLSYYLHGRQHSSGEQQVDAGLVDSVQALQVASPAHQTPGPSQGDTENVGSQQAPLANFLSTRALAFGPDNSTKFSPFLAQGCLSPRQVYCEVSALRDAAEQSGIPVAACEQLIMHLQIRDFHLFTALKHGAAVLRPGGLQGKDRLWGYDQQLFQSWAMGQTGIPFVDACMREIVATGWMSNRGRQNVSSFLTKTLGQDWRLGAELFESLLVDHDWGVNSVNWNYFAGIGNDPRDRHFKVVTQGMIYDENAHLTSWIPALANLPTEFKHKPFTMSAEQQQQYGCTLGADYPLPVCDPGAQVGVLGPLRTGKSK